MEKQVSLRRYRYHRPLGLSWALEFLRGRGRSREKDRGNVFFCPAREGWRGIRHGCHRRPLPIARYRRRWQRWRIPCVRGAAHDHDHDHRRTTETKRVRGDDGSDIAVAGLVSPVIVPQPTDGRFAPPALAVVGSSTAVTLFAGVAARGGRDPPPLPPPPLPSSGCGGSDGRSPATPLAVTPA